MLYKVRMMTMSKWVSRILKALIFLIVFFAIGYSVGYGLGQMYNISDMSIGSILLMFVLIFITVFISAILQIIIHELGHLIFGLLTGYKFVSFRVFNWMILKSQGQYHLKFLKIAGTGGQCLMSPPDYEDGSFPTLLYNFGGVLLNIIVSVIALLGAYFVETWSTLSGVFILFAIIGIFFAMTNGVPMKSNEVSNDGYNAQLMNKDPIAKKALWVQLKVNALSMEGIRLKDMPSTYFDVPEGELSNPLTAAIGVFRANWLLDQECFVETKEWIEHLYKTKAQLNGMHDALLINDLIYIDAILEKEDKSLVMLDSNKQNILKAMKDFPSVLRTNYAVARLTENNNNKATEVLNQFNKVAKSYPSEAEIEGERVLIDKVDEVFNESY